MKIIKLNETAKKGLLSDLLKRSPNQYTQYEQKVAEIVDQVKQNGDEALFQYTLEFDKTEINQENIRVSEAEIEEAYQKIDGELLRVIRAAIKNIEAYHILQKRNSWFDSKENGVILGQKITPLATAGVYVPGGKAAYPSSVLMNVIPAKVAGVKRIVMTTPPGKDGKVNPGTLVAAKEAGVSEIYKAGGAQAVAALAFGTKSVPKVDKIFL